MWKCEAPRAGTNLQRKYMNSCLISIWPFECASKLGINMRLANTADNVLNNATFKRLTVAILQFIRMSKLHSSIESNISKHLFLFKE